MIRYFCCRITPSGIGDMLSQLNRLYDLGRRWGLEYLYRDLPTNRWSPDFDVSDFLGLGLGERHLEEIADGEIVSIDAARASLALEERRPLETLFAQEPSPSTIVEFVHSDTMYSRGRKLRLEYPIALRKKLLERQSARLAASRDQDSLSVCLHIRQGDCTWVSRGTRRVFLGMRKIAKDGRDIDVMRAPPADAYANLLDAVDLTLQGRRWTLRVFTDGPRNVFVAPAPWYGNVLYRPALLEPRILRWLRLASSRNPLHGLYNPMCDSVVTREYEHLLSATTRLTAGRENAVVCMGTSRSRTEDAILAFATADIAILGRSEMAFPLLGLGDPQQQAILLLSNSDDSNRRTLDRVISRSVA